MAGFLEIQHAREAYERFCQMMDDHGWKCERDDEKMRITCGATGDDLPIDIRVIVDADKQLVTLLSQLPFKAPTDDIILAVVGISLANYNMVDGSFDLDLSSGSIIFRLTCSIRDSLISKEAFEYMLFVSCSTVDAYNDKLLALVKHNMSLEDFASFAKE